MIIGVVMVLVALVTPSIQRARFQGWLSARQAHLRQVGVLVDLYLSDQKDTYPIAFPIVQDNYAKWTQALVLGGQSASQADIDPEAMRIVGVPGIILTMGAFLEPARMIVGSTERHDLARVHPMQRSHLAFPSSKGILNNFWLFGAPKHYLDGPQFRHSGEFPVWCCAGFVPGPLFFGDGSSSVETWKRSADAGFVILQDNGSVYRENYVGVPVSSTWHGFLARDR